MLGVNGSRGSLVTVATANPKGARAGVARLIGIVLRLVASSV